MVSLAGCQSSVDVFKVFLQGFWLRLFRAEYAKYLVVEVGLADDVFLRHLHVGHIAGHVAHHHGYLLY